MAIGTILRAVLKTSWMSAGEKSRIERTSRPPKLDIKSLIHRFDLKQSGHTGAPEEEFPRTAPRPYKRKLSMVSFLRRPAAPSDDGTLAPLSNRGPGCRPRRSVPLPR